MSGYLLDWIGGFPDVVAYQTYIVTGVPFEASRWHVRALSARQRQRLREIGRPAAPPPAPSRVTELDQAIVAGLTADGRASYSELAERVGASASTVARRLNRMLRDGVIGLRCDIARAELGWPFAAVLWGSVDAAVLERAAPDLGERVPELRFCSTIAGPENTLLVLWLRGIADLQRVERRLTEQLPGLRVADRRVVLRTMKFMGQILDADERYTRSVPLRLRA